MFSFWLQRGSWKNKEAQVFTLTSNCSLKTCLRRHEPIESLPSFPQGLNIFHQFDFPIIIFQDLICTSIFKSFRSPNNLRHLFFFHLVLGFVFEEASIPSVLKNRKLSVLLWGYAVFSLQNLGKNVCLLIARREFWNEAASVHKDMVILGSSSSKCSDSARTIFYAQRRKISQIIFSFQKHNL